MTAGSGWRSNQPCEARQGRRLRPGRAEEPHNGTKLNERFRSADTVEQVRLEQKDQQFLYEQDDGLVFMDAESFEQLELPTDSSATAPPSCRTA